MGEQRNLTEKNVEVLKAKLDKMKADNPDLEYRFYQQEEKETLQPKMLEIIDRLETLESTIKHIFDGHVLIAGKFQKIT